MIFEMFHMIIDGNAFPVDPFSGVKASLNWIVDFPHGAKFAITGHQWRGDEEWHQLWERRPRVWGKGHKWAYVASGNKDKLRSSVLTAERKAPGKVPRWDRMKKAA